MERTPFDADVLILVIKGDMLWYIGKVVRHGCLFIWEEVIISDYIGLIEKRRIRRRKKRRRICSI